MSKSRNINSLCTKKNAYIFEDEEFEVIILVKSEIELIESVVNNIGEIIDSAVEKFLSVEIEDYDMDLMDLIVSSLKLVYGNSDIDVRIERVGKKEYWEEG